MFKYILLLCFVSLVVADGPGVTCPPDDGSENPTYEPDPVNCGIFYECSGGKPFQFHCPPGTYFNVDLDVCDWNADCGDRSTSGDPPTTTSQTTKKP